MRRHTVRSRGSGGGGGGGSKDRCVRTQKSI